jgi:mannose-1-phosphate guanylyltransferase
VKAVILAGGLGTRLNPYTFFVPKPMLPLGNKPVLEHIIEWIKKSKEIDGVVLSLSYLHKFIENYFEDGKKFNININYAITERPMGTAGQLKAAEKLLPAKDKFVCLSSDHIYNFDLDKMVSEHSSCRAFASMALMHYKEILGKGFIDIRTDPKEKGSNDGNIVRWNKNKEVKGLVNIGCYVFEHEFLRFIPSSKVFPMNVALRKIIHKQKRPVKGFIVKQEFIDIGDKQSYLRAFSNYLQRYRDPNSQPKV